MITSLQRDGVTKCDTVMFIKGSVKHYCLNKRLCTKSY